MPPQRRFASIDALRGFDMVWIIGGDFLVHSLFSATGSPALRFLSRQLSHADWIGFNAYDLVFPLFMFLSGVSLGIVTSRDGALDSRRVFLMRAGRRTVLLFVLGIVYNWGWSISLADIRYASVLGLIGGAYFLAALLAAFSTRMIASIICICVILLGVAVLQLAVPVPEIGGGVLTPGGSINGWIDRTLLPGRLHGGDYDPEGLLAVLSAAPITMAGLVAGRHMSSAMRAGVPPNVSVLAMTGAALVLCACLLWPFYPPIKRIWTSTFDIMAIGLCLLMLAGASVVFDRGRCASVSFVFGVIGANAILVYFAARYLVYPIYKQAALDHWPSLLSVSIIVMVMLAEWFVLYSLYRRRWFLRV